MATFEDRERDFEKRFQHDEELRFKANARRNKMLGLWAADKLGLSGPLRKSSKFLERTHGPEIS